MHKSIESEQTAPWPLLLPQRNSQQASPGMSSHWMFQRLDSEISMVTHYGSYTSLGLNFPISEAGIFFLFINNSNNRIMVR